MAKIALVDDHVLLRRGLASLIRTLGHEVVLEADNGRLFIEALSQSQVPDVTLLDINMPQMDGYETALWLSANHPAVRILALSMYDDENAIIRMLKSGARGYILKDAEPVDLKEAIDSILIKGYYHSDLVTARLFQNVSEMGNNHHPTRPTLDLSSKEKEFLRLVCTEMTYKAIADQMNLSPRTIDGYRDALFQKLSIKSRVGLAVFAIKNGITKI